MQQIPPQNIEAEEAVLGSILIDPTVLDLLTLDGSEFCRDKHGQIYQAMLALRKRESAIDLLTVCDELEQRGQLDAVGGPAYLTGLISAVPTSVHAEHYADIVHGAYIRRELILASGEIARVAYAGDDGVETVLAKAEQALAKVGQRVRPRATTVDEVLSSMWDNLFSPKKEIARRVWTSLPGIDGPLLGIESGRFWAVAAVPGTGKTAHALNIARGVAKSNPRGSVAILYFHPEQPKDEIVSLLWCSGTESIPPIRLKAMMTTREERQEFIKAAGFVTSSTQARDIDRSKVEYLTRDPEPAEIEALQNSQAEIDGTQILLNDPSGQNIYQVLATIRRVRAKLPNDVFLLVVFDGAHLIPGMGEGNRTSELGTITRNLKIAAQKIVTADGNAAGAIIANTQMNREIFQNPYNRVYHMKHLRDSGCLAGDTLVYLPETGERVPIRDLEGRSGFTVLATNPDSWKMELCRVAACFTTGKKPVFRLVTGLGRSIRATANHKFLTINGWKRLDQLEAREHIATPRTLPDVGQASLSDARLALLGHLIGDGCVLPRHAIQYTTKDPGMAHLVAELATEVFGTSICPCTKKERAWYQVYLCSTQSLTHGRFNPVAEWFRELGIFGLRSPEKRIPQAVFGQPNPSIALFLKHLWSTDGTVRLQPVYVYPAIHYTTSSRQLANDVQHLLLRLGINSRIKAYGQGKKGRDQQRVTVSGHEDLRLFLSLVGVVSASHKEGAMAIAEYLDGRTSNTNRDVIPSSVWQTHVLPKMTLTHRQLADALGVRYNGSARYRNNLSREHAAQVAKVTGNTTLAALAESDVYWDPVVSIEPDGEEQVFDISVEGLHNFVANDIVVHNSWEQDADVICFLDRPSVFENGNGSTGVWDPFTAIYKKNRQTTRLFVSYYEMHTSTMKVRGRDRV